MRLSRRLERILVEPLTAVGGCSFLQLVDRYYRYTNRRGHSPEGNPSGGNLYRGLYNITLKVGSVLLESRLKRD